MAVVPWHVRGVEPSHSLGLNDEVLEALVQGVTKMDGAVGVGWPIVKQVGRPATGGLAQLANRFRQVTGLAQHQSQRFVQRRVARLQAHRLVVFADGGGMVADGKVSGGKLRVGGNVVITANSAASFSRRP